MVDGDADTQDGAPSGDPGGHRNRRLLWAGLGVLLLGVGVGVLVVLAFGDDDDGEPKVAAGETELVTTSTGATTTTATTPTGGAERRRRRGERRRWWHERRHDTHQSLDSPDDGRAADHDRRAGAHCRQRVGRAELRRVPEVRRYDGRDHLLGYGERRRRHGGIRRS